MIRIAMTASLLLALTTLTSMADEPKAPAETPKPATRPASVLDFTVTDNGGSIVNLSTKYKGKVLLIVNVASKCGFTPQYKALEKLYTTYQPRGFEILAFPANEFGHQEPGTDEQIRAFCTDKYNVTFDLFSKIVVKGEGQAPLYQFLTDKQTDPAYAGDIKWNFTKFLVSRDGKLVARFESPVKPNDPSVIQAIESQLATPAGASANSTH